jgi:hypothetical protein
VATLQASVCIWECRQQGKKPPWHLHHACVEGAFPGSMLAGPVASMHYNDQLLQYTAATSSTAAAAGASQGGQCPTRRPTCGKMVSRGCPGAGLRYIWCASSREGGHTLLGGTPSTCKHWSPPHLSKQQHVQRAAAGTA